MSPYWRYLVTDPTQETTVNGLSIDAIYAKVGENSYCHPIQMSIQNMVDECDTWKFDHFLQRSDLPLRELHAKQIWRQKRPVEDDGEKLGGEERSEGKKDLVEAVLVRKEYKRVILGPKGGKYYETQGGNKVYVTTRTTLMVPEAKIGTIEESEDVINAVKETRLKDNQQEELTKKESEGEKKTSERKTIIIHGSDGSDNNGVQNTLPPMIEAIFVSRKWRTVHVGPRGGKFYFTDGGSKSYCTDKVTQMVPIYQITGNK
jgi:hypothetical protein